MTKEHDPATGGKTPELPLENTATETNTPKKDKRKKDPNDPTLVPFQLITVENRERLATVGRPDNNTLTILLDAYENRGAAVTDEETKNTIEVLQNQVKIYKADLQKAMQNATNNIAKKDAELQKQTETNNTLLQENTALKQKITALEELSAASDTKIAELKEQLSIAQDAAASSNDEHIKELQEKLKTMTDRATRAEDEIKDNRKSIEGLRAAKAELEKRLEQVTAERDTAQSAYLNTERAETPINAVNIYPEGDILHYFPTITARMLDITAERLTAKRRDGLTITPAMILADMFNKYTIQRWNNWFYWPVLTDNDIIEIAETIDERLTSIRMIKAALNIE